MLNKTIVCKNCRDDLDAIPVKFRTLRWTMIGRYSVVKNSEKFHDLKNFI